MTIENCIWHRNRKHGPASEECKNKQLCLEASLKQPLAPSLRSLVWARPSHDCNFQRFDRRTFYPGRSRAAREWHVVCSLDGVTAFSGEGTVGGQIFRPKRWAKSRTDLRFLCSAKGVSLCYIRLALQSVSQSGRQSLVGTKEVAGEIVCYYSFFSSLVGYRPDT